MPTLKYRQMRGYQIQTVQSKAQPGETAFPEVFLPFKNKIPQEDTNKKYLNSL